MEGVFRNKSTLQAVPCKVLDKKTHGRDLGFDSTSGNVSLAIQPCGAKLSVSCILELTRPIQEFGRGVFELMVQKYLGGTATTIMRLSTQYGSMAAWFKVAVPIKPSERRIVLRLLLPLELENKH